MSKGNGKKAHATRKAAERRQHLLAQARDGLVKAAAALTEPDDQNRTFALFHTLLALVRMAKYDDDLTIHDRVLAICAADRADRSPGPYSGT